ncbi:phenylacetate-CoA oxygenase/reductase subunit PaaK [Microbacterium esteraromaticum]|uniref:Phenylacetate-CoA oxygenase/reductase subunit PaaK n=1 Tax=Microbacterium esteraromaticum TaxID=57043 RepID=A0A939DUK8_9MICO|nr:1,2-phenylacetyl-CoA epoxidase subunit PaaE [Microbacterium esteraromaticum]MBN8205495.1 phenylacetate-CoA oxygenase/reductase subunit PaaK [Microbacterium esteraromaticum]MBN8415649.1 phenylacetate-CoA oxygenase/reductase subunit PaaK [Microbacterium esteraromaticum]
MALFRVPTAQAPVTVASGDGGRHRARFHALTVSQVRPLTKDAVEVSFAVPPELVDDYAYLPGQYVALRVHLEGAEVRRSYSLCRPPIPADEGGTTLSVAVKRDEGGLFSTWAQTELTPGFEIDVMSPQGTFTSGLAELAGAHVVGIAAGSGITPMMALARSLLTASDSTRFTLLYTNKATSDVMFLEDLADLKDRYPTRLVLHHVLSREQRTAPLMSGRLDEERLRTIFGALILPDTVDEWFLCGPFALVDLCREVLADLGVPREHVRFELFTTGDAPAERGPRKVEVRQGEKAVRIEINLDGVSSTVESPVDAHESVLNAALRVRPDAPFACSGGVCGTCRARVVDGSVTMTENYALEPDEIERGYVLTCQSHPTSDRLVVDYDV